MRHIVLMIAKFHSLQKKVEELWQIVVLSLVVVINLLETRCSTELTAIQSFPRAEFLFAVSYNTIWPNSRTCISPRHWASNQGYIDNPLL